MPFKIQIVLKRGDNSYAISIYTALLRLNCIDYYWIKATGEYALLSTTTMDLSAKISKDPDRTFDTNASIIAF